VTVAVALLLLVAVPSGAVATGVPADTESTPSTETTPSTPGTSRPGTTDPSTPDSTVIGAVPSDDGDATTLTWFAIVAGITLLGVAVWWMLRQSGGSGPMQPMDDDWPRESDVI
jgi:hypothetical protein